MTNFIIAMLASICILVVTLVVLIDALNDWGFFKSDFWKIDSLPRSSNFF